MHTHRNTSRDLTLRSPDSAESVAETSAGKQNTMARAHQQPRADISKMRFPMARTKAQHAKTVDIIVTFQRLTQDYHCEGRTTNTMTRTKALCLPPKMDIDISDVLRLPRKTKREVARGCKSIAPVTQNEFRHVSRNVEMSQNATPAAK